MIELKQVTKRYGDVAAVDALSFTDLACDVADIDGSGQVTVNVYR